MPKSFGKKIAKGFGKNLAKSFKYGVIDTFLEKNAPDILETMRSNKDEIKSLIDSSGLKDLSKKDIGEMLNKQTTEIKKSLGEVKKNLLSDIKSGRWFGNQERSSEIMTKFIFGGEDEFNDFFNDDLYNDLDDDSETSSSSEEFGDIDFNFDNSNETNITDNRANVNNITTIENRVDGKLLASVTSQLVGSMSTVSTQIKQISQFHLDETRQYYSDSLRLLTDINNTLKNVYTLQTPKGKTSVLEEVFTGNNLNILSYGKAIAGDFISLITDEDNKSTIKTMIDGIIADPLKTLISETMDLVTPKAIKKGMEELNSGFIDTVKTLVMQLSEGKNGKGTPLQKFLGSFLGLNMSTGNGKAAFKNAPVPFDSETKRSIVNTIPELLSRIYGKVASISSNGNGEDNISSKDRILRVDNNTGELGYDVNKKVRKSDSVFAKKLAGENYDYSRAGLTEQDAAAQRKIDRLNKQIKDLQNNRKGFLDSDTDKAIYRLKQRINKFTNVISDEGKDKIRQAQKTRDEDYEEYSEMLYKYAVDLGSKRGLSPSVIKTINAKEFDRRKAGGIVSNTELSKDIEKLSPEQQRVFASLIKQIETYNANQQEKENTLNKRTSKEIWQDSKDKNRRADGKLGIKGSFKAISDYTNEISKQFFDKLNKGLSNVIFGNENGLKKNATNKFKEKVNGWVDKYKDETNKKGKNTLRSKIAKKIDIFNKNRESERERREKEMAGYQKRSADAIENLMNTFNSENCGSVRYGNETEEHGVIMQLKKWLSIKLGETTDKVADKVGVSTTETKVDNEGNTVIDDDGNVVEQHRATADIKSDIKNNLTSKIKNKIMTDKMKTDGVSENEKITKLLHLRMKEFMDPVTSTFKEKFFGDNEDSLKSKINEKLFSDNEDSVKSQIKNFLFGSTDSAGNKTKKSLLDRLSGDFISYLRNPTDKDGKPLGKGNSFIDKWKDTLGIFADELRHFGKIAIDIAKKGLKFYYKTLFSIVKRGFKFIGSSGVTKLGTEMGKRVMGVTNFINKRAQSIERDQWERVGGVLKRNEETGKEEIDWEGSKDKVDLDKLKDYRHLAKKAKEKGIAVAESSDTNIIRKTITTLQENVVNKLTELPRKIGETLHELERLKGKHADEMRDYKSEAKKIAKQQGLKGKAKKNFEETYSNTRFDLEHDVKSKLVTDSAAEGLDPNDPLARARRDFNEASSIKAAKKAEAEKKKNDEISILNARIEEIQASIPKTKKDYITEIEQSDLFKNAVVYKRNGKIDKSKTAAKQDQLRSQYVNARNTLSEGKELKGVDSKLADLAKGAFDKDAVEKAKKEEEIKQLQSRIAESSEENVEETKKSSKERRLNSKKLLSYVAMGFLLLKGGTKTVTTVIQGIFGAIKTILKLAKVAFKILAFPLKVIGSLARGATGKLLTSGALITLLYTYLASKVKKGYRAAKDTVVSTVTDVKNVKSKIFGGTVTNSETGETKQSKGLLKEVSERIDARESKKRAELWKEAREYARTELGADTPGQAILAKKFFDANYEPGMLTKAKNKIADIKSKGLLKEISERIDARESKKRAEMWRQANEYAIGKLGADASDDEKSIVAKKFFDANYIPGMLTKVKNKITDIKDKIKNKVTKIKDDFLKKLKDGTSKEELMQEAIKAAEKQGLAPDSPEYMQFIHNYIKANSGVRGFFNRVKKLKSDITEKINSLKMNTAKKISSMEIAQKTKELAMMAKGALENFKKSQFYKKAALIKDKAIDGVKRVIETVGSGIKGIGTAVQAIPIAGKVAAAAIGAAGLATMIALVTKKIKAANSDKKESSSDDSGSILSSFKKLGKTKEQKALEKQQKAENKQRKKEDKLQKKKEKIKSILESPEFPKLGKVKQLVIKGLGKKYGITVDKKDETPTEVTSNSTGSKFKSIAKKAIGILNPAIGAMMEDKPKIGQEKDGLLWNGSKWISKGEIPVGQKFGNMVWNGERLVSAKKDKLDDERRTWNERVLSTGLLGEKLA